MEEVTQKLVLLQRERLTMTGAAEVLSFDENAVVLRTDLGILTVQGQGLHLKTLSQEGGQVEVDGSISALEFEEPRTPGGWLRRLLG